MKDIIFYTLFLILVGILLNTWVITCGYPREIPIYKLDNKL